MKLLMISGSYPPQLCGVGDYTEKLVLSLRNQDITVEVLSNIDWSLGQLKSICRKIDDINADLIHIQFPSIGYKYSFLPQILSLRYKTIVTIHEASQFHPLRKLWLLPLSFKSDLIFTNQYEYKYFKSIFPWAKVKPKIIPIGSNIEIQPDFPSTVDNKTTKEIIYFGLIRPKKGIEQLMELARLVQENNLPYRIKIIGQVLDRHQSYFSKITQFAKKLPVDWEIGLSEASVSTELNKHAIAYLPFPDGASERRGSLLALLKSGLLVFTTRGVQTPVELESIVRFVKSPEELIIILTEIDDENIKKVLKENHEKIKVYVNNFEWLNIAKTHLTIYEDFLKTSITKNHNILR